MARRNWTKCECGAKLHVKKGERMCYPCKVKESKG
jgi:hypothetical protein